MPCYLLFVFQATEIRIIFKTRDRLRDLIYPIKYKSKKSQTKISNHLKFKNKTNKNKNKNNNDQI